MVLCSTHSSVSLLWNPAALGADVHTTWKYMIGISAWEAKLKIVYLFSIFHFLLFIQILGKTYVLMYTSFYLRYNWTNLFFLILADVRQIANQAYNICVQPKSTTTTTSTTYCTIDWKRDTSQGNYGFTVSGANADNILPSTIAGKVKYSYYKERHSP